MAPLAGDRLLERAVCELAAHVTALPSGSPDLTVTRMAGKDAWRVMSGPQTLVLKRYRPLQSIEDVRWEHAYLRAFARTGFPAPVPLTVFSGESCCQIDGRAWGALTFLPGRSLAWEAEPGIEDAGALLAIYHGAARRISQPQQRPTATPLRALSALLNPGVFRAGLAADDLRDLRDWLVALAHDLDACAFDTYQQVVVHGDATTDNMVIDRTPPRLVGLIDFGSAHVERWPADLGAVLWRSGRARPENIGLDPRRVAAFVLGYHRRAPLPHALALAVPTLIMARGLQLFVRRALHLTDEQLRARESLLTETLLRTRWVHDHQHELQSAISGALRRSTSAP